MSEPSGAQWCDRYPTSHALTDLEPAFQAKVTAFINALKTAGAQVTISATYRPPQRAYLMHWCWMIAREGFDPAAVPAMAGIAIAWLHKTSSGAPDIAASRSAAAQMAATYDLRFEPSLTSRHIQRRAVDMTISWEGVLQIKTASGVLGRITSNPRNGQNQVLYTIGAGYGVHKLPSDPPHWSDDGH